MALVQAMPSNAVRRPPSQVVARAAASAGFSVRSLASTRQDMLPALLLALGGALAASPSCVDEDGVAVDWWFMLKHPRWADVSHKTLVGDGLGSTYVFVTSRSRSAWKSGAALVTDERGSLLGEQLAAVYDGSIPNYVFYNDQQPDGGYSSTYGRCGLPAHDACRSRRKPVPRPWAASARRSLRRTARS